MESTGCIKCDELQEARLNLSVLCTDCELKFLDYQTVIIMERREYLEKKKLEKDNGFNSSN
jgi:hypothetical protein